MIPLGWPSMEHGGSPRSYVLFHSLAHRLYIMLMLNDCEMPNEFVFGFMFYGYFMGYTKLYPTLSVNSLMISPNPNTFFATMISL